MHLVDWIALGIVGLGALSGLRRGLVVTVFSLAGLAAGATIGARAPPRTFCTAARRRPTRR